MVIANAIRNPYGALLGVVVGAGILAGAGALISTQTTRDDTKPMTATEQAQKQLEAATTLSDNRISKAQNARDNIQELYDKYYDESGNMRAGIEEINEADTSKIESNINVLIG